MCHVICRKQPLIEGGGGIPFSHPRVPEERNLACRVAILIIACINRKLNNVYTETQHNEDTFRRSAYRAWNVLGTLTCELNWNASPPQFPSLTQFVKHSSLKFVGHDIISLSREVE